MIPLVFLFPHSSNEFSDEEELRDFLRSTLPDNDGRYRVITANRYTRPHAADIVVFHKNRLFVGEARIRERLRRYERPESVGGQKYEGQITFDPKSVRVYEKPPGFDHAEMILKRTINRQAVQQITFEELEAILGSQ